MPRRRNNNNFHQNQHQAWGNRTGQAVITTQGGPNTVHPANLANTVHVRRSNLTVHYDALGGQEQVHQHGRGRPHQTAQGGQGPNRHRSLSPATRAYF